MSTQELQKIYQTIQTHLNNDEWIKSQDPELVNAVSSCESIIYELSQQLFIFLDAFEQYANILEANVRVPAFNTEPDSKEWIEPTQTPAEPEGVSFA
jgi:hypothetical protein